MKLGCATQLAEALIDIGVKIPEDSTGLTISCSAAKDHVVIIFHKDDIVSGVRNKTAVHVLTEDGDPLLAQDFYGLINEDAQLPEQTSSFTIRAESISDVVLLETISAFNIDSISNLKGCTFKTNKETND